MNSRLREMDNVCVCVRIYLFLELLGWAFFTVGGQLQQFVLVKCIGFD